MGKYDVDSTGEEQNYAEILTKHISATLGRKARDLRNEVKTLPPKNVTERKGFKEYALVGTQTDDPNSINFPWRINIVNSKLA